MKKSINVGLSILIIKKAIIIASTRLILLLIPTIALALLSSTQIELVENYALSHQYIQIALIILISLNVGLNILIPQAKEKTEVIHIITNSIGFNLILSLLIILLFYHFSLIYFNPKLHQLNTYLLLGLPFTALYLCFSSTLEAIGLTKFPLYIAIFSLLLIAIVAIVCKNIIIMQMDCIINVCVTLIRILQAIIGLYLVKKYILNHAILPRIDLLLYKKFISFGISEMFTAVLFTSSIFIALYLLKNQYHIDITYLSISFNYKNIISLLFISYCISYTIYQTNLTQLKLSKQQILTTFSFYFLIYLILFFTTNEFSLFYTKDNINKLSQYLYYSQWIIILDSIGLFITTHLRINNDTFIPPLFRLTFVFLGIPLAVLLSYIANNDFYFLYGILIGNGLFALLSICYLRLK